MGRINEGDDRRACNAAHADPSAIVPDSNEADPPMRIMPWILALGAAWKLPDTRMSPVHDDPEASVKSPSTTSTPAPVWVIAVFPSLKTKPDQQPAQSTDGIDAPAPTR